MDDEVEVAIMLWNFIQLTETNEGKQHWVHPINQKRNIGGFIDELRGDATKFYNYCRMKIATFDYLLNLLSTRIQKKDTNCRRAIKAEERLLMTLRFLATGDRFQYMHYNFRIGATTAGKIVSETCVAIWEVLSPLYLMTTPTPKKWGKIADRFEELWNYPNCCGAIDGKHIRIEAPWNCGSAFLNYKSHHSIILQAVVDAEGKFIVVDVGEAGRNNDGGVFMDSSFGKSFNSQNLNLPKPRKLEQTQDYLFPYVFVADDAYGLHRHLMKPYARSNNLNSKRKIYNYRHSRARRIVECAFGMMAKKFRIFESAFLVHPDITKYVVLACCALHNLIREREGNLREVYDEILIIEEIDCMHEKVRARAGKAAYDVRENFATFFNSDEGSVPWQDKMALCK